VYPDISMVLADDGPPDPADLARLMRENSSVIGMKGRRRFFSEWIDASARVMTTVWTEQI
jgi:hypothetical protein